MANVLPVFTKANIWRLVLLGCSFICWLGVVTYASLFEKRNGEPVKNKFVPGCVLENIQPSGLLMCRKLCFRRTDCCGCNFNTIYLTCSLLSTPCPENELKMESRQGYIYIFLGNSRNQKERNRQQYSKCVSSPGRSLMCLNFTRHRDCEDIPEEQINDNHVYKIHQCSMYDVQCQRFSDSRGNQWGSPWTIIQRRFDGSQSFSKNWNQYKNGFGDPKGEYWIGNQALYEMTSRARYQLLVLLTDFDGREYYALYSQFSVRNESLRFRLTVDGYSGNAGNSLSYHNEMPFSTSDRDNGGNCGKQYKAGWWYKACHGVNLNGQYFAQKTYDEKGLCWFNVFKNYYSFKNCTIMIKRKPQQ